jgi:hypothetical protein
MKFSPKTQYQAKLLPAVATFSSKFYMICRREMTGDQILQFMHYLIPQLRNPASSPVAFVEKSLPQEKTLVQWLTDPVLNEWRANPVGPGEFPNQIPSILISAIFADPKKPQAENDAVLRAL